MAYKNGDIMTATGIAHRNNWLGDGDMCLLYDRRPESRDVRTFLFNDGSWWDLPDWEEVVDLDLQGRLTEAFLTKENTIPSPFFGKPFYIPVAVIEGANAPK